MNEEQVKQLVNAMNQQGASQEEIQRAINSFKPSTVSENKPGFVQDTLRAITSPLTKTFATLEGGALAAESMLGVKGAEEARADLINKGQSFGSYLGSSKPFGAKAYEEAMAGEISKGQFVKRAGLEATGNLAEIASYGFAPGGAIGKGFWATTKAALPMATAFGTAKALQAGGEGKGTGEAVMSGVGNTVGALAGFGLVKGAGNLFANFGARLLQTEGMRVAGQWANQFAEKVWNAIPEAFTNTAQKGFDYLTNQATRRAVNALRQEFNTNWKQATNSLIDATVPNVDRPDLTLSAFQRSLSESLGNNFRVTNSAYDVVKADPTAIGNWGKVIDSKLGSIPEITGRMTQAEFNAIKSSGISSVMQDFANEMRGALRPGGVEVPQTLGQVMGLWERAMSYIPKANNEERAMIRDFASSLYSNARSVLGKDNPALLDAWDASYQSWKNATDLYESGFLNNLKSVGQIDTFIDRSISGKMTRPEQETILASLKGNEEPVRQLFISSVLEKAKTAKTPEEGAKILRSFLDSWDFTGKDGSTFLGAQQQNYLDKIAGFMEGKFEDFVGGMQDSLPKGTAETAEQLLQQKNTLNIAEMVDKGNFNQISDNIFKLSEDPQKLQTALSTLNESEKRVVGLSLAQNILKGELKIATPLENGKFSISPEYVDSLTSTWTKLQEMDKKSPGILKQFFSEDQLNQLQKAADYASTVKNLENIPETGFKKLLHGAISMIYFARGWLPGGIRNLVDAAKTETTKTKAFYGAIDKLIDESMIKKNSLLRIGDLLNLISKGSGQAGSTATGSLGQ